MSGFRSNNKILSKQKLLRSKFKKEKKSQMIEIKI